MAAGDPIDYSAYYGRIATALETLATNSTDIKNSLTSINTHLSTVATNTTSINTHLSTVATNTTTISTNSTTMTTLATGTGIHIVSPYEWLGYASLYKLYVEDTGAIGLAKLSEYKDKIKSLPTIF